MKTYRFRTLSLQLFIFLLIPFVSIILPCIIAATLNIDIWLTFIFIIITCGLFIILCLGSIDVEFAKDKIKMTKYSLTKQSNPVETNISDIMFIKITYSGNRSFHFNSGNNTIFDNNKNLIPYFYLSIYSKGKTTPDIKLAPAITPAGGNAMYQILLTLLNSNIYIKSDKLGHTEYINKNMLESEVKAITCLKSNKASWRLIFLIIALLIATLSCVSFTIYVLLPLLF